MFSVTGKLISTQSEVDISNIFNSITKGCLPQLVIDLWSRVLPRDGLQQNNVLEEAWLNTSKSLPHVILWTVDARLSQTELGHFSFICPVSLFPLQQRVLPSRFAGRSNPGSEKKKQRSGRGGNRRTCCWRWWRVGGRGDGPRWTLTEENDKKSCNQVSSALNHEPW